MADFDDFELNQSDLAIDNEMDPFDYEKLKILDKMNGVISNIGDSIRYHEKNEVRNLIDILVNNTSLLVALDNANDRYKNDDISESEIEQIIKQVYAQTTEINSKNIEAILPEFNEGVNANNDSTDDGDVDF